MSVVEHARKGVGVYRLMTVRFPRLGMIVVAARRVLDLHANALTQDGMAWLSNLPYSRRYPDLGIKLCHGSPIEEREFDYIFAPEQAFALLDEPFTGIDPLSVHELQAVIRGLRNKGIGVLITDHNVRDTLKITDRASIIKDGKVFASGDPETLAKDPLVRQVYLGEEFQL